MHRKKAMAIMALFLITLLMFGCNLLPLKRPQAQGKSGEGEKIKVLVSIGNTAVDNYEILQSQLTEMGKEAKLEFTFVDAHNDALKQSTDISKAAEEKAKVIIVEPIEPDMLKTALQDLQKKGIKIICVGNLPTNLPVDAYITPDFRRAGEIQGQQVLEKASSGGKSLKILILRGPKKNKTAEAMLAGNMATLQGQKSISSISVEEVPGWNASTAFEIVKTKLTGASPPQAILTHSPEITAATIQAVEQQALQGQVQTYGMGTQVKAVEALAQGKHLAEVDFMPEMLAQTLNDAAKSLSKGESWQYERQVQNGNHNVPAKFIPIRSITVDNLYLLQERMEKMKKDQEKKDEEKKGEEKKGGKESSGGSEGGGQGGEGGNSGEGGSGEGSGGSEKSGAGGGQAQKKTTLKIKTKDGNTFQMEIAGEVESVEVNGGGGQQGQEKGQEGQKSQGGQGGGGGGGGQ